MKKTLRIVYMGTPDFAASALYAIVQAGHDVVAVYSQPPRRKGRGQSVQKSPVHQIADQANIQVFHPESLKSQEAQDDFAALNADIAIVAAYGLILPQDVLDAPQYGCVNIHASLLPRWRGASPIQHAIWRGDSESGVTLMNMEAGLDTGPMIAKRAMDLNDDTTASGLHDALAEMGADMVLEFLNGLNDSAQLPSSEAQDNAQSNYAPMLKKKDGHVDWVQNAPAIHAQIRALNPWPGVFFQTSNGEVLKLKSSILDRDAHSDQPVGTLLNKHGDVVCGESSVLRLETAQPAGKAAMDIGSAINGRYVTVGDVLS
jgi:methionyl-tRNA formyltransferase